MGRETIPLSQDCTTAAATKGRLTKGEQTQHGRVSTAPSYKGKGTYCGFITDPLVAGGSQCNTKEVSRAVQVCLIIETK